MNTFKLYYSNTTQNYKNCLYPNKIEATTVEELKQAVSHDYVAVLYKNSYRQKENFLESELVFEDIDNDHSDKESDWITEEDIAQIFYDVPFFIHYSKSHLKEKKGKGNTMLSPRPRFHIGFTINKITDENMYALFKERLHRFFPFFDDNAKDSARFMAGTLNPEVKIFNGNTLLDDFLEAQEKFSNLNENNRLIEQGSRNSSMHRIAVNLLKRYGNTTDTKNMFIKENERCNPPLEVEELKTIWKSASKFFNKKILTNPNYKTPEEYNGDVVNYEWDEPISLKKVDLPSFPIDSLPSCIADYVVAVAETTQTPIDMSATAALAILALCLQGKYKKQPKADWKEPLNLYTLIIAEPSERKSAIISLMTYPLIDYEIEYNKSHSAMFEFSKLNKNALENKKKSYESQLAKGKISKNDMLELSKELADFKEQKPKKLFVDNITTEKLTSILSDNDGKSGIISSEGGLFDVLSGMYSKAVNIDVFLKAYSGDTIRVDRVLRPSEIIQNPCLSILLSVQPSVLANFIKNSTFDGKGFTSRFLYAIPNSFIGARRFETTPIEESVKLAYENKIKELLKEEDDISFQSTTITLSKDAFYLLEEYFNENEKAMLTTNQDIKTWAGKLVGNVVRIAGILCRCEHGEINYFLEETRLVVSKEQMQKAINIGRYFTEHSRAAHSLIGLDPAVKQCEYILSKIKENNLTEFTMRNLLKICRSFRKNDEVVPSINRLTEYGYIQPKIEKGRPSTTMFLVNPAVLIEKTT